MNRLLAVVGELFRRHRCAYGCEFRTHRIEVLAQHYWVDHYGDPAPKKEYAR